MTSTLTHFTPVLDLASATPVEIDTELYWQELASGRLNDRIVQLLARRSRLDESYTPHYQAIMTVARELIDVRAALGPIELRINELSREFLRRGGWNRAYFVTNNNGHIHRSTQCTTCYWSTQFRFLPQVSGMTDEEIVSLAGETACTVCYPEAPVDVLKRASRLVDPETAAKKAERAAEKATKDAAKAAKAITAPDGTPLRIDHELIKTEVTAQRYYVEAAADAILWGPEGLQFEYYGSEPGPHTTEEWLALRANNHQRYAAEAQTLLEALAAKRGTTVEQQREALAKKVIAKLKRDYTVKETT